MTNADWERRKQFIGFTKEDEDILHELHLVARAYADQVLEELYRRWLAFPEMRRFFENDATLRHVKSAQRAYFIRLTSGKYDLEYAEHRLRIGCVHKFVGLTPRWYMGAYAIYLEIVLPRVLSAFEYDRIKQHRAVSALTKLISLDQELALMSYYHRDAQPSDPH